MIKKELSISIETFAKILCITRYLDIFVTTSNEEHKECIENFVEDIYLRFLSEHLKFTERETEEFRNILESSDRSSFYEFKDHLIKKFAEFIDTPENISEN